MYLLHLSLSLAFSEVTILCQINPLHILQPRFFDIRFRRVNKAAAEGNYSSHRVFPSVRPSIRIQQRDSQLTSFSAILLSETLKSVEKFRFSSKSDKNMWRCYSVIGPPETASAVLQAQDKAREKVHKLSTTINHDQYK